MKKIFKVEQNCTDNYISIDSFAKNATQYFPQAINGLPTDLHFDVEYISNHNCIIWCCSFNILELFSVLEPYNKNYLIIANHGDLRIDWDVIKHKPKCIKKIYAQNVDCNVDCLMPIPIGTVSRIYTNKHGSQYNCGDFDIIKQTVSKESNVSNLVYANFSTYTNKTAREKLLNFIKDKPYITNHINDVVSLNNYNEYTNNVYNHKFMLSPEGNGIDCHRTWEAIYLGTVPIVKNFYLNEYFAKHLPIILVDSFEQINEHFLQQQEEVILQKIYKKEYNFELLNSKFWQNLIQNDFLKLNS